MQPNVRRIVFVIAGIIVGAAVNMGLVQLGTALIPPPAGVDVDTPEGLRAAMSVFETKHFVTPFVSHAVGTFAGAFVSSRWSGTPAPWPALIVALLYLIGGISMVAMIGNTPLWFVVLDLGVAYLPMGLAAHRLARRSMVPGTL